MTYSIEAFSREPLDEGLTEVLNAAKRASAVGTATSENGAHLYGHVPHVAPQAWFHIIFPSLDPEALTELDNKLKRPVPEPYRKLLTRTNGLDLFSGALSLYGLRHDYSRRVSVVEPYDLGDPNIYERPRAADPSWFIFAFYDEDGSSGYLDPTGRVFRANRDMTQPRLNQWASLDVFLRDEVRRLQSHFDDRGRPLDPSRPTTPDS